MALMSAVAAMVRANWRYSCPVMPPRNAVGRNTAISTSVMAMTGPVTSFIAWIVASRGAMPLLDVVRRVLDDDDGVVHDDADGQHQAEQGEQVDREARAAGMKANAPMIVTGTVVAGTSSARQLCRNTRMTISTSTPASSSVVYTSWMAASTNLVVSNGMLYSIPGGQRRLDAAPSPRGRALATSRAFEPGKLVDEDVGRVHAVAGGERVVGLRPEFDAGHVAQVDDLAGRAGLDDDPLELLRVGSRPSVVTVIWNALPGRVGRLADLPGRHLHVLPRQGGDHVLRSSAARAASLSGSSQTRMAYDADAADHHVADARRRGSARRAAAAWRSSTGTGRRSVLSGDVSEMARMMFDDCFLTVTPCRRTSSGQLRLGDRERGSGPAPGRRRGWCRSRT